MGRGRARAIVPGSKMRRSAPAIALLLGCSALATGVLGPVSAAWSCSVVSTSIGVSPQAAPERTTVQVRGTSVSGSLPIEIHWNGVDGPVIATAVSDKAGSFAADVAVPAARPGVYSLVAVTPSGPGVGRTAFEVAEPVSEVVNAGPAEAGANDDAWGSSPVPMATKPPASPVTGGMLALTVAGLLSVVTAATLRRREVRRS